MCFFSCISQAHQESSWSAKNALLAVRMSVGLHRNHVLQSWGSSQRAAQLSCLLVQWEGRMWIVVLGTNRTAIVSLQMLPSSSKLLVQYFGALFLPTTAFSYTYITYVPLWADSLWDWEHRWGGGTVGNRSTQFNPCYIYCSLSTLLSSLVQDVRSYPTAPYFEFIRMINASCLQTGNANIWLMSM